jgi:hypothetical protein
MFKQSLLSLMLLLSVTRSFGMLELQNPYQHHGHHDDKREFNGGTFAAQTLYNLREVIAFGLGATAGYTAHNLTGKEFTPDAEGLKKLGKILAAACGTWWVSKKIIGATCGAALIAEGRRPLPLGSR